MYRAGHIGAALLAYAPVGAIAAALGFDAWALAGVGGVASLAMLPDIDHRIPGVEHRGPTHTVWFALTVGIGLAVLGGRAGSAYSEFAAVAIGLWAFLLGSGTVMSHIVADALTPAGVCPFAPLRTSHYSYGLVSASNRIANYSLLCVGLLAAGGILAVSTLF